MDAGYILIILHMFVISISQKLPEYVSSECYGNTFNFDCGQGHNIRILKDFYGYSVDNKCVPSPDDCIVPNPNTDSLIHRYCTGKKSCPYFQVERRACNGVYTNYQQVEYQCVPEKQVTDMCQILEYSTSEIYLSSPNFPQNYPPGLDCSCFITSNQDTIILLEIIYMSIKHNFPCGDWLRIGRNRMCGMNIDLFSGQQMPLEFHSDNEGGHAGFWLNLKASRPGGKINVQCRNTTLQELVRRRVFQSRQRSRSQQSRTYSRRTSSTSRGNSRIQQQRIMTREHSGLQRNTQPNIQQNRRMQTVSRYGGTTHRGQVSSLTNRADSVTNIANPRVISNIRQNQQAGRGSVTSRDRSSEDRNQFVRQRQPVSNTRDSVVSPTRYHETVSNNTRRQDQEVISDNIGGFKKMRNQHQSRSSSKSKSSETSSEQEQKLVTNSRQSSLPNNRQKGTNIRKSAEELIDTEQMHNSSNGRSETQRNKQQISSSKSHETLIDQEESSISKININRQDGKFVNTRHSVEDTSRDQHKQLNNKDLSQSPVHRKEPYSNSPVKITETINYPESKFFQDRIKYIDQSTVTKSYMSDPHIPTKQLSSESNTGTNVNKEKQRNIGSNNQNTTPKTDLNFGEITGRPENKHIMTHSTLQQNIPIKEDDTQKNNLKDKTIKKSKASLQDSDQSNENSDSRNRDTVSSRNTTSLFDFRHRFNNEDEENENIYTYKDFFTPIIIDDETSSNSPNQDIMRKQSKAKSSKGINNLESDPSSGNKSLLEENVSTSDSEDKSTKTKGNIYFRNKSTKDDDALLQYTTPASFNIERFLKSQFSETSRNSEKSGDKSKDKHDNKEFSVDDMLTMFTIPSKMNNNVNSKEKVKTSPPQIINVPITNIEDTDRSLNVGEDQFQIPAKSKSNSYNKPSEVRSKDDETPLISPSSLEASKHGNSINATEPQSNSKKIKTVSGKEDSNLLQNITDSQSHGQDLFNANSNHEEVLNEEYDLFQTLPNINHQQYEENYDTIFEEHEYINKEFSIPTLQNYDETKDKLDYPMNTDSEISSKSNSEIQRSNEFLEEYVNKPEDIIYDLEDTDTDNFDIMRNSNDFEEDAKLNEEINDYSDDYDHRKLDVLGSNIENKLENVKDTSGNKAEIFDEKSTPFQEENNRPDIDKKIKNNHNIKKKLDDPNNAPDNEIFNLEDVVHGQYYFGNFADNEYDDEYNETHTVTNDVFGNNTDIVVKPVSDSINDGSVLTIGLIILSVCVAAGLILLICFLVALLCQRRKRRSAVAPRPTLAIIHAKREMLVKQQHDADSGRSLLIHAEQQQNQQLSSAESYAKGRGHQSIVDVDSLYAKPHKKDKTVQADMNDGYEEVFITKKPIFTIDSSGSDTSLSNFQIPTPPPNKETYIRNHKAIQAKAKLFKSAAADWSNSKNNNSSSKNSTPGDQDVVKNIKSPCSRKRCINNTNSTHTSNKLELSMHGNYPAKPNIPPKPAFLRAGGRTLSSNGCASNTGNTSADTASNVVNELKDSTNPKHSLHKKTIASMPGLAEMTFMPENSPVYYEIGEALSDDDSDWETKSAISL